jgi:tagatose 6-phosphate kinase
VPQLRVGAAHRVDTVHERAGGKATNTARILAALGEPVTLVAPLDEPAHARFAAELAQCGVGLSRVPVVGPTRSSVAITDGHDATVFNEAGSVLSAAEWAALVATVAHAGRDASVVVIAGSMPPVAPGAGCADLITAARVTGTPVVVDASGTALRDAVEARADVVTPNVHETRELLSRLGHLGEATGSADAVTCAGRLVALGAHAAVVTAGADGMGAVAACGAWSAALMVAVQGNPTGAGDAVTACIARGIAAGSPWPDILLDAVATSAAAVRAHMAGHVDVADRTELLESVTWREHGSPQGVPHAARAHR